MRSASPSSSRSWERLFEETAADRHDLGPRRRLPPPENLAPSSEDAHVERGALRSNRYSAILRFMKSASLYFLRHLVGAQTYRTARGVRSGASAVTPGSLAVIANGGVAR
jgi:hypothetical protein